MDRRRVFANRDKLLFPLKRYLDRPIRLPCQETRDRLKPQRTLGTKSAAQRLRDDPDPGFSAPSSSNTAGSSSYSTLIKESSSSALSSSTAATAATGSPTNLTFS